LVLSWTKDLTARDLTRRLDPMSNNDITYHFVDNGSAASR